MLPDYLNIRDVDKRIREVAVRLNRLPYVVTISSCEGHVLAGVNGLVPWELTEGLITLQVNGNEEARKFVRWMSGVCERYEFVYFQETEASTEEEMNRRLSDERFRLYGFKFPLGKAEYHIITDRVEGDKESVINSKRKVDKFWRELTTELAAYE